MILNEAKKREFSDAVRNGRSVHAYIVEGADGSGKLDFAKYCASALVCSGEDAPCGSCPNCKKHLSGNHPDVIIVEPQKDKKTISVDEIRQLRRNVSVLPNEGLRKVYVITRGELLTDQVQNSMLKMIEEPPSFVTFFILTSKREALLPTIRSRCLSVTLSAMSVEEVTELLAEEYPKEKREVLESAARRCGGRIGRAKDLLGKENRERHKEVISILETVVFSSGGRYESIEYLEGLKYKRDGYVRLFDELTLALRDLILHKFNQNNDPLFFEEAELKKYLHFCSKETVIRWISLVEDVRDKLDKNMNQNAALTYFVQELWNIKSERDKK